MNNLSNALPIMVNNYAKLFGVSVRIQGSTAYTNGKVITIPRLDIKNPIKARLAYGYLAHESAHIRYTDFSILKKDKIKNNLFLFSLFNILEDSRIRLKVEDRMKGLRQSEALFQHWGNLPDMVDPIVRQYGDRIACVCVSYRIWPLRRH